jgi:hypothetical protein
MKLYKQLELSVIFCHLEPFDALDPERRDWPRIEMEYLERIRLEFGSTYGDSLEDPMTRPNWKDLADISNLLDSLLGLASQIRIEDTYATLSLWLYRSQGGTLPTDTLKYESTACEPIDVVNESTLWSVYWHGELDFFWEMQLQFTEPF